MKFSILHPSARPDKWREVYDAWIAAAAHPENVEYVLVADQRWGFSRESMTADVFPWGRTDHALVWNTAPYKHSGYVSSMNLAAKAATGDVLIGIADDLFPPERWDSQLFKLIQSPDSFNAIAPSGEFVIWCPTGTPREWEREIAIIQILNRARYERLGYVFYPEYESMYADRDFVAHAKLDAAGGRCAFLKSDILFDHRHWLNNKRPADAADNQQNHGDLYSEGARLFAQRQATEFATVEIPPDHLGKPDVPVTRPTGRRKIYVVRSGEWFHKRWLEGYEDLLVHLGRKHDLIISSGYAPLVHVTRTSAARDALQTDCDYILWIDDDQPPFNADLLLETIENSDKTVGMVAGWTLTVQGFVSFGVVKDGQRTWVDKEWFLAQGDQRHFYADWTGLPMAIMRREMLADVGADAFLPYRGDATNEWDGFVGEDIGFCQQARAKGWLIGIDKRVHLEHLKVVDVAEIK